jgi:hypothetical protein
MFVRSMCHSCRDCLGWPNECGTRSIQSREAGKTREVVVAEEAVVNAKAIDANKLKVILNVRHTRLSQTAASCLG